MSELRRSYAMSHLRYSYDMDGQFIVPFVIGVDDQTGENITDKASFAETRGHYWLWKNKEWRDDELVSFQQYRRCFWFPHLIQQDNSMFPLVKLMNLQLGQTVLHMSRGSYIDYIHHIERQDRQPLNDWLRHVDIVVPRPLQYTKTIAQMYGEHHNAIDWEVFSQACRARGFDDGRHNWLSAHLMGIMRADLFDEYMTQWWAVMSEIEPLLLPERDEYQSRKIGFLSERFMSAWLVKMRTERPTLRIQTLPIVEGLFQHSRPSPGVM